MINCLMHQYMEVKIGHFTKILIGLYIKLVSTSFGLGTEVDILSNSHCIRGGSDLGHMFLCNNSDD